MNIFGKGAFTVDPNASPDEVARKRAVIAALMPRYGSARYTGEGIGQLITGIAAGRQNKQLAEAERNGRAGATDAYNAALGGQAGGFSVLGPTPSGGGSSGTWTPAPPPGREMYPVGADAMPAPNPQSAGYDMGREAPSAGLDLIRGFEGFRETPYWDVNALRTGYGSDTVTLPDGTVQRVAEGTRVTREDADRDLQRRVDTEFAPIAAKAVGQDVFGMLPENQQAALISIAYNYGELPSSVARAVASGDPQAAASAITALGSHNGGVNASRRASEAAYFMGAPGSSVTMSTMGGAPQAPQQDMRALYEAAANPWLTPEQRQVVMGMIGQAQQRQDPSYQMGLEKQALELAQLRNPAAPKGTSDMQEYEFARGQGYQGTFQEYMTAMKQAGAANTTVTVGGDGAPGLGKLSPDYGYVLDPATGQPVIDPITGLPTAAPVPGSPAAIEAARVEAARGIKSGNAAIASDVVTSAASRAREAAGKRELGGFGSNLVGWANPYSDSAEVIRQVEVLKSNAKIENLTAMRAASPTGGALGAVSDKESEMLAAKSGALDPQSPNFLRDLDDYERTMLRIVHGPEAGDAIFEATRGTAPAASSADGWTTMPNGVKIRVKQ